MPAEKLPGHIVHIPTLSYWQHEQRADVALTRPIAGPNWDRMTHTNKSASLSEQRHTHFSQCMRDHAPDDNKFSEDEDLLFTMYVCWDSILKNILLS
jgi:hypothetical protein